MLKYMKLYQYKKLNLGFVILCPDNDLRMIQLTVNSIRSRYDSQVVAAVSESISEDHLEKANKICPTFCGSDTITSLINVGMDNAPSVEWNMIVMSGMCVKCNLDKKYSYFIESDQDILYAILDGFYSFIDCSLNGLMIHKKVWNKIGPFCTQSPLPLCKLFWAQRAIDLGIKIKGVIGIKMP